MNKYSCVLPGRKLRVRRGLEILNGRGLRTLVEEPGLEVERRRQGVAVRARRAHSVVRGRPERGLRGGEDRGHVFDGRRGACVEIKFRAPTPSSNLTHWLISTQCGPHSPESFQMGPGRRMFPRVRVQFNNEPV